MSTVDDLDVTERFRRVATSVLDAVLAASPEAATDLGDHRFDDRLSDYSATGVAGRADLLADGLSALDAIDDEGLVPDDRVDLEILRTLLAREQWTLTELREHEHNPLLHLPGDAIYPLLAREVGDPAERLAAVAARLRAVPEHLDLARRLLHDMPRVHVETAIAQIAGVQALLDGELGELLERAPALRSEVAEARLPAAEALRGYQGWLREQLLSTDGDPRLGAEAYAAKLWYELDSQTTPDSLLTRAESDLQAVEEEIAELASSIAGEPPRAGLVREVLDRLAADQPADDATILPLCRRALADATARVRELDLVTVPDDDVQIIVMPESRRGYAVAYCDPPGPLEPPGVLPTLFAVSPTPADWPTERVASFYREYNGHLVRNLTVHEAMPGHVLQLAHSARFTGSTAARAAASSGVFIEGWAVYAESVLAGAGLGMGDAVDAGLRMQRLKTLLRSTINAILDVRVHAHGMTEAEAMALMTGRGHQEDGEAAGKWRRALLTSAQLATYYVGYHEVRDIAAALRGGRPDLTARGLHDAMLAHGSPPPRHLRTLLGLPPNGTV
jgi:uncharacterized protein (DUF885 family)